MSETNNHPDGVVTSIPVTARPLEEAKPIEEAKLVQETKVIQETKAIEETKLTKTISDPYPWRSYVNGGMDSSGYKIVYLIHKSDDFAIYLDEETAVTDATAEVEAKLSALHLRSRPFSRTFRKTKANARRSIARLQKQCGCVSSTSRMKVEPS